MSVARWLVLLAAAAFPTACRSVPSPVVALDPGWLRDGPLGETPKRSSDALPLSDQANRGGWVRVEALSDEFSGSEPDRSRWWLTHPTWPGRAPFAFAARNASVRDGWLVLTASARLGADEARRLPPGFTHTAGFVRSKTAFQYGYAEIRAQLADTSVTSTFFLMDTTAEASTEIDVFEIAAGHPYWGRRMGMSRHVMKLDGESWTDERHPSGSATWVAPFLFSERPHVFGLEWDRDWISWYLDGVLLHRARNELHHRPLRITLDLEAQRGFAQDPMGSKLPAEYRIDYVRVWTRGASVPMSPAK